MANKKYCQLRIELATFEALRLLRAPGQSWAGYLREMIPVLRQARGQAIKLPKNLRSKK